MSRATTITYANTLLDSLGDTTQLGQFYDELSFEVARGVWEDVVSVTDAAFVRGVGGTALYVYPSTAVRLLSVHYDSKQLAETTPAEADVYDRTWRVTPGDPIAYTEADEDDFTVRLVPVPAVTGIDPTGSTPYSFTTWPNEAVAFIFTDGTTDVHSDEEMWFALEMVARELARDSNHHDANASELAKNLADLFRKLSHTVR